MYKDGYYLTHIWAYDPYLQMKKEMLNENSKSLQLPKKILEQAVSKYNLQDYYNYKFTEIKTHQNAY